jgi:crossover junction endodeoxyribonuclease RuvC
MAVIGIDPGTALTGYGIVEENSNGDLIVLGFGVIETSKNTASHSRLLTIYTELEDVLSLYRPESSAVERLFFQKNTKTALAVGQARGVILLSLAKAGIEISEYNPVEIKQAITGYGQASKKQMQEMVKILLRLDSIPQPDDAADALAIAICHIHSRKMASLV